MSAREVERLRKEERLKTTAPAIKYYEWTNKKTGEIHQVPEGIDPGWDYHVGAAGFEGMDK